MSLEDDLGELVEPPNMDLRVSGTYDSTPVELDSKWKKYLASLTVADILAEKRAAGRPQLVFVESEQTIADGLHILAQNSILSVPVLERKGDFKKWLGFVDVLDIVRIAVRIMSPFDMTLHEFFSNPFFEEKITAACGGSGAFDDWLPVQETTTLMEVLCTFNNKFRPHRLPVVDVGGNLIGIISQTDILRVAAKNMNLLENAVHKSIGELKLEHLVITARTIIPASNALGILSENRVHGLAVVEPVTSKLIANLSASDLVGMTRDDLILFDRSVVEFLEALHKKKGSNLKFPISCTSLADLGQVISLMVNNHVHRVFVTDQDRHHALGVISVVDVIIALKNC